VAAAADASGPVSVLLTQVSGEAEPTTIEGELAASDAGGVVTLTFEAPPGQWSFALPDDAQLLTPAGERIIDHTSLTGTAGVRTGPGLDGTVAGDPSCGTAPADPTDAAAPDEVAASSEPSASMDAASPAPGAAT
jgi:hypothetical protein